jgi:hypothetical protein
MCGNEELGEEIPPNLRPEAASLLLVAGEAPPQAVRLLVLAYYIPTAVKSRLPQDHQMYNTPAKRVDALLPNTVQLTRASQGETGHCTFPYRESVG